MLVDRNPQREIQGFTVWNCQISHACAYLTSQDFYICVVTARPPALYDELIHTLTDTHTIPNRQPTSGQGWSTCLSLCCACETLNRGGKFCPPI